MQSEDRIIHFSAEFVHPPIPMKKDILQKLYFDLSKSREAAYDSSDFSNPVQPRFYSRRGKKTQSVALFLTDRVVIIEEWTDMSFRDFLERLQSVATHTMAARGIERFMVHTGTIRSTFALTHFDDARVFLMDHACAQAGKMNDFFQRPIATGGLRFVLPETQEHPGNFHVLIESFRHSRNEVFVEVKGVFPRQPITAEQMGTAVENLESIRAFITDSVFPYMNQFDQPRDPLHD
jgi:hypothetical protein